MANKNRQNLTRRLGSGLDEFSFHSATLLRSLQHRQKHLTDPAELAKLHELTQSSDIAQLLDQTTPPSIPEITIQNEKMHWLLRWIGRDYRYTRLTFPSAVDSGHPSNDYVYAHHLYRPNYKNAPTLLYLHGWMQTNYAASLYVPLRWAEASGYNLIMLELPHHLHRSSPGTYSGELSLTGNLSAVLTTIRQAVSDIRALNAWLHARGIEQVALVGKSLGGMIAAMALTLDSDFDCAILLVPAIAPHSSLWRSSYTRLIQTELAAQGLDEEATRLLLEAFQPGHYPPAIDPKRILVIGASGDRVVFQPDLANFAEQWQTQTAWLDWGHLSTTWTAESAGLIKPFLAQWLGTSS